MSKLLDNRLKESHKGTYGKVGIIGGSFGMSGSITLATQSALRSGSGYVYTVVPKSLLLIMSIKLSEGIIVSITDNDCGHFIKESINEVFNHCKNYDVIAIGMGMGTDTDRSDLVRMIVSKLDIPILLDADAINSLAKSSCCLLENNNIVITPHPGEMANFLDLSVKEIQAHRKYYCELVANKYKITVVLKGHQTIVSSYNQKTYINNTGNPGMATAGSGDVLSGIIASLIGQGISVFEASKLGVYLHGLAGDIAVKKYGEESLIASDIVNNLYKAIRHYKSSDIIL